MFSFFTAQKVEEQLSLQQQVAFIVEQCLLYESRHIVTMDRWRKFGQLHHELLVKYEFHRKQQHLLRTFHEAEARRIYERMNRVIQLFDCYKLMKSQQLPVLEERLRFQHTLCLDIYEQFMHRHEQRYSEETDAAFFQEIYGYLIPIIVNINEIYM